MSSTNGDKLGDMEKNNVGGEANGVFDTGALSNALQGASANGVAEDNTQSMEGWVERAPYDYNGYSADAPARDDWDGNAPVYQWDGEEGDLGPEHPELEAQLFGDRNKNEPSTGIDFSRISEIELTQEGPERVEPALRFQDGGLHPAMLKNVELCGYKTPTPIQAFCIPAIQQGFDVIGIAQTGSGKTAAYLIPVINKLMGKAKKLAAWRPNPATYNYSIQGPVRAEPLVVVVCPTRELAVQIFNEARKLCYRSMLRPGVVYGGGPFPDQIRQICMGCDILVATPGRLLAFMDKPELLTFRRVKYMVIDEADEMLQEDWSEDLDRILSGGEQDEGNINYFLFSATFPHKIRELARTHLAENHVRFRVGRAGSTCANIVQNVVRTDPAMKKTALIDLIKSLPPQRTMIFVNSKHAADDLDDFLYNQCKLPCTSMHSDRTQREREDALRAFRSGAAPILITTGVTGRGIDVRNVAHVINFDLPSITHGGIEEYTHRIGRTGRIGHRGLATSFFTSRDDDMASVLTRTLLETNQEIPEFLSSYVPEGDARQNLKFEADSDWEDDCDDAAGGGAWDPSGDAPADAPDSAAPAWGPAGDENANTTAANTDSAWGATADNQGAKDQDEEAGGWTGGSGSGW